MAAAAPLPSGVLIDAEDPRKDADRPTGFEDADAEAEDADADDEGDAEAVFPAPRREPKAGDECRGEVTGFAVKVSALGRCCCDCCCCPAPASP